MTWRGPPILYAAAAERGQSFVRRWTGQTALFCCVLAHTDTCLLPGISAAGATETLRPFTPAADAEAVLYGAPRCLPGLPQNPLGPPGPVAITRAAILLAGLPVELVAAGLRVWPDGPCLRVPCAPGGRIDLGAAVPEASSLYRTGLALGAAYAQRCSYLVLGESVPGGTTTALALLLALGVPAAGKVSGSLPDNAHPLKEHLAAQALVASGLTFGSGRSDPLAAAAAVGDPMQPLAAGIATGASRAGRDVLLAGGSQMVAVAALVAALDGPSALDRVAVGTTRWVVHDPAADVPALARLVAPSLPLMAANLNLRCSRHPLLRRYESFLVKEGVGAGGACIAALAATDIDLDQLHAAIDDAYDRVMPTPQVPR